MKKSFVLTTLLVMVLPLAVIVGKSVAASANTAEATSPDKSIVIKAINPTNKAMFRYPGGFGFNFNEKTPENGNKFLVITIESTFPKGAKELEMMEFYIRSKGDGDKTILLAGYAFANQDFFFDTDNSILAVCFPDGTMQSDFRNVMPGKGTVQLINEGGYSGGKSEIRLLFEVPEAIFKVEVLRGKIIMVK